MIIILYVATWYQGPSYQQFTKSKVIHLPWSINSLNIKRAQHNNDTEVVRDISFVIFTIICESMPLYRRIPIVGSEYLFAFVCLCWKKPVLNLTLITPCLKRHYLEMVLFYRSFLQDTAISNQYNEKSKKNFYLIVLENLLICYKDKTHYKWKSKKKNSKS